MSWVGYSSVSQANSLRVSIRIEFSIADLNAANSPEDLDDSALFDDQASDDGIGSGAHAKAGKSDGRSPSASNPAEEEEDFDDDQPVSFPSRVNVTIEKVSYGYFKLA